ncbi:unnamed protein product, partial [Amoebophrya sp. A120]
EPPSEKTQRPGERGRGNSAPSSLPLAPGPLAYGQANSRGAARHATQKHEPTNATTQRPDQGTETRRPLPLAPGPLAQGQTNSRGAARNATQRAKAQRPGKGAEARRPLPRASGPLA